MKGWMTLYFLCQKHIKMLYHQFFIAIECQFFYNCDGIIVCSSPKNLWEYQNRL